MTRKQASEQMAEAAWPLPFMRLNDIAETYPEREPVTGYFEEEESGYRITDREDRISFRRRWP